METMHMNTAQLQWTITIDDMSMVNTIKKALMAMKGVVAVKDSTPRSVLSEKEYYAMLDHSIEQAEKGNTIAMNQGESVSQFLARIACTH